MCSPWNRNTSSILASQQVSEPWIGPMPNLVWEALQSWRELLRKIPPGEVRGKQRNEVGRWGTGIWERDGRTEGVVGEECLKATTWGNVSHMLWMACSFFFFFRLKIWFIQASENTLQWNLLLDAAYTVLGTTHILPYCFQKTWNASDW